MQTYQNRLMTWRRMINLVFYVAILSISGFELSKLKWTMMVDVQ